MTIYQKELLRKLPSLGYTGEYDESTERLCVSANGIPLCEQTADGYLRYNRDKLREANLHNEVDALADRAKEIRDYVELYNTSPPMGIDSVKEYRKLAEFGDVVLGGMYSEDYGFMFSTWRTDKNDRTYLTHGDYSPSFDYAKESFVTRSGLVSKHRLFTESEAADLYRCVDFAKGNCETLTYDKEKQLGELADKLTYGYPSIEANPPTFEQGESLQQNM